MKLEELFEKILEILNENPGHLLPIGDLAAVMTISVLMSMFIFVVYKMTYQGVSYARSFNISLMMICMITSMVIMTISSNIILSLGMVGALSIVRFRTAIKDPMDVVFMFWAIAVGIANGALYFAVSVTGSVVIAIMLFLFTRFRVGKLPCLLIIKYDPSFQSEIRSALTDLKKYKLKSKVISGNEAELTIEMYIKNNNTAFANRMSEVEGVRDVVLVSSTETIT